jgi:ring-1,2-phenylacetyl-CoA epoxidase subunit PaaE
MKVVILNGAAQSGDPADRLASVLESHLAKSGDQTRHFILHDLSIGHCLGDLDCWVRTPGRCRIKDEGQEIERAVHDADMLALITPVTFGGYSAHLKRAMDRLIPLILPFFVKTADMTHHAHRYARLPWVVGIGVDKAGGARRAHLFKAFVESNALNLGAPVWSGLVLGTEEPTWELGLSLALKAGAKPGNASGSAVGALDALREALTADILAKPMARQPKVAVLQASARPEGQSTSLAIARYLAARLEAEGATAEIVPATVFARGGTLASAAAHRLATADVLAVASPLYVDALPALGVLALEQASALRRLAPTPQRVIGLINCGFPEPEQTRFAFTSLREFAREAGAVYAGGIAIGGGEAIHGRDLVKAGGQVRWLRAAIDQAATALAEGGTIPVETSLATAKATMPPLLYRFAGFMQWTLKGWSHGLGHSDLAATPFDALSDADWEREAASGSARARPLRVIGKRAETDDAVTILFEDPTHDPLVHHAGQFITVELVIDGERARRSYSLASAPFEPGLAITAKRVPGGLLSNALHDRVKVGDILRTHGPSGGFTAGKCDAPRRLALFGGGSGIVPLASIARAVLREEPQARVTLVYGASSKARAIYADALDALAAAEPERFTLHGVLEAPEADWPGARGRLDEAGIGALADSLVALGLDRALICGPDAMRASVTDLLARRGVAPEDIVQESFASPRAAAASSHQQIASLVSEDGQARPLVVAPGATLLDTALDAGVAISFSCMSGSCGACRVTVTDGLSNVVLDEPNDVSPGDRARGVLPACLCRLNGPISFAVGAP